MANICTFERDGVIHAHPEYRPDLAVTGRCLHEAVGHAVATLPAVFGVLVYGPDGTLYEPPPPPAPKPTKSKPAD